MATLHFTKTHNGTVATISGTVNSGTQRVLQNYIERKKLDVQATTINPNSAFPTSWEQHVQEQPKKEQIGFKIRMY